VAGWGIDDHLAPFTGECFGTVATGTPVAPLSAAAAAAVTPLAGESQLPATGTGDAWPIVGAGALALILLAAGLLRRRNQGTI
jgi:LPXTG-motif cell wall-anchored protein